MGAADRAAGDAHLAGDAAQALHSADAAQALAPAIDNGVVFVPGTAFHDDPTMGRTPGTDPAGGAVDDAGTRPGARNLRLAFSSVAPDRLTEGVRRLAEVF